MRNATHFDLDQCDTFRCVNKSILTIRGYSVIPGKSVALKMLGICGILLDFQCLSLCRLENMCPRMTVGTSFDAPRSEECNAF